MISDMKQPAKNWLADHLNNFGTLLDAGNDPSCTLKLPNGIEVEIRLNKLPGVFERQAAAVTGE